MADILTELRKCHGLNGNTYSSYEVIGMVGQAAAEIERLREALEPCMPGIADELRTYAREAMPGYPNDVCSRGAAEIERLRAALREVATDADAVCTSAIVIRPETLAMVRAALEQLGAALRSHEQPGGCNNT